MRPKQIKKDLVFVKVRRPNIGAAFWFLFDFGIKTESLRVDFVKIWTREFVDLSFVHLHSKYHSTMPACKGKGQNLRERSAMREPDTRCSPVWHFFLRANLYYETVEKWPWDHCIPPIRRLCVYARFLNPWNTYGIPRVCGGLFARKATRTEGHSFFYSLMLCGTDKKSTRISVGDEACGDAGLTPCALGYSTMSK